MLGKSKIKENARPHLGFFICLISVTYDFAAVLLVSPVRLRFDSSKKRYVVKHCSVFQQIGCLTIQILSSISAFRMLTTMWGQLLANPGYVGAYFDFMNGCILHCYTITVVYFNWFRVKDLDEYVDILQTNPLVLQCNLALWKAKLLPSFCWCLTIYMAFIWVSIVCQINLSSWEDFLLFQESAVSHIFGQGAKLFPKGLGFVAIVAKFYHGFLIHLSHNVFGTVGLFCAYFLANDFSNVITKADFVTDEVIQLYQEYKNLLKSVNVILTPFNVHFVAMTLTYHSLHLFDALNTADPIWKVNTYLYLLYLVNFLYLPVKTSLMVKRSMKKLLWENQNYLHMSKKQLGIILDDFKSNRLDVKGGGYFTVNSRFSGKVIQQLIYYSMLNTLAKQAISV